MMRKRLMMLLVLLAALGLLLAWRAGGGQEETRFRVYLPLVEKAHEEAPLPPPVAWRVSQLATPPGYITSLAATSEGAWLAVSLSQGGLQAYRSLDGGGTWTLLDEPVLGREVRAYRLYASPADSEDQVLFAIGFSGLARSLESGSSWRRIDSGLPVRQMVALAFSPDYGASGILYALSAPAGGTGPYLYVSKDRGESWQVLADVADIRNGGLVPNDLAAFVTEGLVIATSRGILRTEDSGATWQREEAAFAEPGAEPAIRAIARLASGQLLALGSGRRVPYKSEDGGRTWRWTGAGMEDSGPWQGGLALAVAPGRVFMAAAGAEGVDPGLFYSPDGDSWRPIQLELEPGAGVSALYATSGATLLVAAGDQGLWKVEAAE